MKVVLGIDPGLDGGFAALSDEGLALRVMPTFSLGKRRLFDETVIAQWLMSYVGQGARVYIEAVHAMPRQGVVSMFSFGTGWGLVRGICVGLGLSYELVRPQEWQGLMLCGQPQGSEYLVASRLWPNAEWRASSRCRKAHSGLVDSALIAEYGRRINAN